MISFPSQKSYEKIELFLRRHWLILFFIYLGFGLAALAGALIFYLADRTLTLEGEILDFGLFLLGLYILIIWQLLFKALTDFYLDSWIVSDHRILDIRQTGLFRRGVSELRLSKIQDVKTRMEGILPTFFNYGDVMIQTAGAVPEFRFEQIPHPQKVKDKILELHDQYIKQHIGEKEVHELLS